MPAFGLDHSFARQLPGLSVPWKPAEAPAPHLLYLNEPLATELGLVPDSLRGGAGAALFAGNALPEDAQPVAQAYAGHQFGGFSPQLGDGRALLIGELVDRHGHRRDIAFKGSGRTPFSRGGDGKAVVGAMLREVLVGECMHALGIPTTRALAVAATGETVRREVGFPGAVLTRVAASHLRVGSFEFLRVRRDLAGLTRLLAYAIARHDPSLLDGESADPSADAPPTLRDPAGAALALLDAVLQRQARLIAQWMNVGFIHGVMNTDNMTISGETIDYGPCAFMEAYDPHTVFSSIDTEGRYAYVNQPAIAQWNLARLAEALLPLVRKDDGDAGLKQAVADVTAVIEAVPARYEQALLDGQRAKLGLHVATRADDEEDRALAEDFLKLLKGQSLDFTSSWRLLAQAAEPGVLDEPARVALRDHVLDREPVDAWLARWAARLARDTAAGGPQPAERAAALRHTNPRIIARNHRVEAALAAATDGDMAPFEQLLAALQRPWDDAPGLAPYAEPAPTEVTAGYRTFCGT